MSVEGLKSGWMISGGGSGLLFRKSSTSLLEASGRVTLTGLPLLRKIRIATTKPITANAARLITTINLDVLVCFILKLSFQLGLQRSYFLKLADVSLVDLVLRQEIVEGEADGDIGEFAALRVGN